MLNYVLLLSTMLEKSTNFFILTFLKNVILQKLSQKEKRFEFFPNQGKVLEWGHNWNRDIKI